MSPADLGRSSSEISSPREGGEDESREGETELL